MTDTEIERLCAKVNRDEPLTREEFCDFTKWRVSERERRFALKNPKQHERPRGGICWCGSTHSHELANHGWCECADTNCDRIHRTDPFFQSKDGVL